MGFEERVVACFQGLATGDAIGKQTETLSPADVRKWYPGGITGFHGRPGDVIPRYAGKRYEWRIGETTDDTEQTLAVARALLARGDADHEAIGTELLHCRKSVHPGVSMWSFLQAGDPARIASGGDGCGAAMRSAPIGVIYSSSRLDELMRGAYECAIPTHGGQLAIGAAAAVAGAVSAAIDGRPPGEVLAGRDRQPRQGRPRSRVRLRRSMPSCQVESTWESTKLRSVLSRPDGDHRAAGDQPGADHGIRAKETALLAANLGGDADSVASIGGAIAGAMHPESVNVRVVRGGRGDQRRRHGRNGEVAGAHAARA